MEASSSGFSHHDEESRALEGLLDIFGSTLSLKVIASAFCKAGGDPNLAADILTDPQGCSFSTASDVRNEEVRGSSNGELRCASNGDLKGASNDDLKGASNGELRGASFSEPGGPPNGEVVGASDREIQGASNGELREASSSKLLSENVSEDLACLDKNSKGSKQKSNPVSVGTVSSFLGKGYSRPTTSLNGSIKTAKPIKINLKELPPDQIKDKYAASESPTSDDLINRDLEDFLFKMLGDGFQLGMDVIREVLGSCGYNATESIEKLIDISASTLKKRDDIDELSAKSADEDVQLEQPNEKLPTEPTGQRKRTKVNQERYDLQKELFSSLFTVPERVEEVPKRPLVRAVKKSRSYGIVVCKEPSDPTPDALTDNEGLQGDIDHDAEEDDNYLYLRKAARENWLAMKEYYKAAIDAFATGNHKSAEEFLERGRLFNMKAREADEKSAEMTLECGNKENMTDISLDLHGWELKDAIRLLKHHLACFSGIANFHLLKVIVETDSEDSLAVRRKRLVLKLLERESIQWTEEEDGKTVLIPLDDINPQKLSFKKDA